METLKWEVQELVQYIGLRKCRRRGRSAMNMVFEFVKQEVFQANCAKLIDAIEVTGGDYSLGELAAYTGLAKSTVRLYVSDYVPKKLTVAQMLDLRTHRFGTGELVVDENALKSHWVWALSTADVISENGVIVGYRVNTSMFRAFEAYARSRGYVLERDNRTTRLMARLDLEGYA